MSSLDLFLHEHVLGLSQLLDGLPSSHRTILSSLPTEYFAQKTHGCFSSSETKVSSGEYQASGMEQNPWNKGNNSGGDNKEAVYNH